MADGIQIGGTGLKENAAFILGMARRCADLRPAYRVSGVEFEKRTRAGFAESKSQFGVPFKPLAPSTVAKYLRRYANKRTKSGKLTKGSQRKREALVAHGGIRPLVGRRNRLATSFHWVPLPQSLTFYFPGDMIFHISGGQRNGKLNMPPVRNPTVFIKLQSGGFDFLGPGGGSKYGLDPSAELFHRQTIDKYILTGKAA